jgi:hypothetical protein
MLDAVLVAGTSILEVAVRGNMVVIELVNTPNGPANAALANLPEPALGAVPAPAAMNGGAAGAPNVDAAVPSILGLIVEVPNRRKVSDAMLPTASAVSHVVFRVFTSSPEPNGCAPRLDPALDAVAAGAVPIDDAAGTFLGTTGTVWLSTISSLFNFVSAAKQRCLPSEISSHATESSS